jgi:predicted MFS family arabinose efflux permease
MTEIFPTQVEATCVGIIESAAQIGIFLGPIANTYCINHQIYPLILFSVAIILLLEIPLGFIYANDTEKEPLAI